MKKIIILAGLFILMNGYQLQAGTDWCSGENCSNKGYWYDIEERCKDEYNCDKYCKARTGAGAVEETCSQGSKNCKCRKPLPQGCDKRFWSDCGGKWEKPALNGEGVRKYHYSCKTEGLKGACAKGKAVVDEVWSQDELNCKCK
jgi:hypothetical protein